MRFVERFIFLLGIAAALKVLNLNAVVASEKRFFLENAFKTNETATASLGLHYYPNAPGLNSRNVNGYGTGGLGKCQGDCDTDSDCASGLKCWQRSGYTDIPGCTGGGSNDWDYCTDSKYFKGLSSVNVNGKGTGGLGMCQGDCDRDSDCASGLRCFQRNGHTAVPGCTGSGSNGWDYCVDKKFLSSPNVNGKGTGGLGLCEGDCDRDSDCASGLKCFQRNGYTAIPGCRGRG